MRKSKLLGIFIFSLFALTGVFFLTSQKAFADTFTVNSVNDGGDNNTGDNLCNDGSGKCTLRAAIEQANATINGADTINFNLPGAGVHIIAPSSNFPTLSSDITIDGTTQPGSNCGTLVPTNLPANSNAPHMLNIFIDATNMQMAFDSGGNNVTVKGFAIANAQSQEININSASATIECNYIGTDATGADTGGPSNSSGIVVNSDNAIIQNNLISGNNSTGISASTTNGLLIQNNLIGTTPTGGGGTNTGNTLNGINISGGGTIQHNIISGNGSDGIAINNGANNVVKGNLIGVTISGIVLGNQGTGLSIFAGNNFTIGGTTNQERNIISANTGDGVHIYTNCQSGNRVTNSTIFNNYIGTKSNGTISSGYGNGAAGIEVNEFQSACNSIYQHQIGGDNPGEPNIIAGNTTEGILIHQDSGHDVFSIAVLKNSIFGNGTLGIDLAADSQNDGTPDTDMGPNPLNNLLISYPTPYSNSYLNHPVINSAAYNGNNVSVNYDFAANAVTETSSDNVSLYASDLAGYRLDFYINNTSTDGTYDGYAQGKTHLGSFIVDGSETNSNHTFASPVPLNNNQTITATATILWKVISEPRNGSCGPGFRQGNGPPYVDTSDGCK